MRNNCLITPSILHREKALSDTCAEICDAHGLFWLIIWSLERFLCEDLFSQFREQSSEEGERMTEEGERKAEEGKQRTE